MRSAAPIADLEEPALGRDVRGHDAALEDDDREIILMRHHELLSNGEVAAALKLTEAAASMRYLRAVRRLKAALVPEETG